MLLLGSDLEQARQSGMGVQVLTALVADEGFVPYDGPADGFARWVQELQDFVADDCMTVLAATDSHGAYVSVG